MVLGYRKNYLESVQRASSPCTCTKDAVGGEPLDEAPTQLSQSHSTGTTNHTIYSHLQYTRFFRGFAGYLWIDTKLIYVEISGQSFAELRNKSSTLDSEEAPDPKDQLPNSIRVSNKSVRRSGFT